MNQPMPKTDEISRVRRTISEARANYDRISPWYDLLEGYWEEKARQAGLAQLSVAPGERAMEIGFGTGHCIVGLARAVGGTGKVYGLDLSPRMTEVTRNRVERAGLGGRVELTVGEAQDLPYAAGIFDAVFMSFALELFDTPEIPVVLGECRRVLKEKGRISIVSLTKEGRATAMRRLYEWGHEKLPRLLDCRPIFVARALGTAGFEVRRELWMSIWGLPVEVVLAVKPADGE